MSESASVLIVGAGPSGLILALSLLQNKVSVRIIEKERCHRVGERGSGIMPRTLELHNLLGILPDILKVASPVPKRRAYAAGEITPLIEDEISPYIEPTFHTPYPNPKMLGQNHLEAILREHLKLYGAEVELATTLDKFEQHDDHVIAHLVKNVDGKSITEHAKFSYLVGTDGAHSVVRKQLGFSFLGETMEGSDMVVGDIVLEGGLERQFWNFWGTPEKKIVYIRPSGQDHDVVNFMIGGVDLKHVTASSGREDLIGVFKELSGRSDLNFGEIRWISHYRPNIRMVDKFHAGRVFIAGDAAHCHTPAGGQGMNSSSQDAFNLGWKLALVIKGLAPLGLLNSYDEERVPVIAEMLNLTTALFKKNFKTNDENDRAAAWKRGPEVHMLSVNYRSSSLVIDDGTLEISVDPAYNPESATAARAGDRAPDASALQQISPSKGQTSLFQLFGCTYHTVLMFGGSAEQHKAILGKLAKLPKESVKSTLILSSNTESFNEGFDAVVVDIKGYAFDGYHIPKDKLHVVVVRPDGVVGARVVALENLDKYFSNIFL